MRSDYIIIVLLIIYYKDDAWNPHLSSSSEFSKEKWDNIYVLFIYIKKKILLFLYLNLKYLIYIFENLFKISNSRKRIK